MLLALLIIGLQNNPHAQVLPDSTNDFKIGMFSARFFHWDTATQTFNCDLCSTSCHVYEPVMRAYKKLGNPTSYYPSSQLKVLGEDGFNIVLPYTPAWSEYSSGYVASLLQHFKNSNMQCLFHAKEYYQGIKADYNFYHAPGDTCIGNTIFDYNIHPDTCCGHIPNYNLLIDSVCLQPRFREVIWGYNVTEEASARHYVPIQIDSFRTAYDDNKTTILSEIPVSNVVEAIDNIRSKDPHRKMAVLEACHNAVIQDGIRDTEALHSMDSSFYSYYQPYEYLKLTGYSLSQRPDVFIEGSFSDPNPIWLDWYKYEYDSLSHYEPDNDTTRYKAYHHYLGPLKSIDWAYQYVDNVQELLSISAERVSATHPDDSHYYLHTHPDSVCNANYLHFQAYTSIIHKVNGVWFWSLDAAYLPDEASKTVFNSASRFVRDSFPRTYNHFVTPLSRQLRYLVNKNLLTTDLRSHVAHRTDSVEDKYNIIKVNNFDILGLFDRDAANNKITVLRENEHYKTIRAKRRLRPPYSPRYTLRTNGKEDLLIVSNPLFSCVNATLDLSGIAQRDDIIRNADSCYLLFEGTFPTDSVVRRIDYKVFRDTIDWRNDTLPRYTLRDTVSDSNVETVPIKQYETINYATTIDSVGFGPADVHLFQFGPVDNQWYDKLCDTGEEGGAAKNASPLAVDNSGTVYYLDDVNMMMSTSVDARAATSLGFFASPQVHFAINQTGTILYYADSDLRLRAYDLAVGMDITGITPLFVRTGSNIVCRNNTLFFVDADNQIVCINEMFLQRNQPPQIVSTISLQNDVGFAVSDDGRFVYYLSADNQLCLSIYSNFAWSDTSLLCNVTTQFRGNTQLHYVNGTIYGIRASDGRVHRFYCIGQSGEWRLDWLGSDIVADEGTDIAVVEEGGGHSVYFVYEDKIYRCRENNVAELLSPTDLATAANGTRIVLYDDKIIFVGTGDRIHTLSYRHNYTRQADLYIKDSPLDVGMEENNHSPYFYVSEDIWVRRQNDGLTQHRCETPSFDDGITYVYVRVRNKSLYPSPDNATLTLYWQWANVSASWPAPWDGSMGDDKGGVVAEIPIPSIPGDSDTILEIQWSLPSPRFVDTENEGHYCLLAKIEDALPMVTTGTLLDFIKENNNVAMRNISIRKGRYQYPTPLVIANYQSTEVSYILQFEAIEDVSGSNLIDMATVLVGTCETLSSMFYHQSTDMELYDINTFKPITPQAQVLLTLPPNSEHYITLRFEPDENNLFRFGKTNYRYRVQLLSEKGDEVLNGEEYWIEL